VFIVHLHIPGETQKSCSPLPYEVHSSLSLDIYPVTPPRVLIWGMLHLQPQSTYTLTLADRNGRIFHGKHSEQDVIQELEHYLEKNRDVLPTERPVSLKLFLNYK